MTFFDRFNRFERQLPELFDELALPRRTDYLNDILARTATTRQRPGWAFRERWLPMSALTRRLAAVPRFLGRLATAVALLLIAAILAVLIVGAGRTKVPAPFGLARNGQILYINDAGQIAAGDPATRATRVLIADGAHDLRLPTYSQDGTRIAFTRRVTGGFNLMAANADGSNVRVLTPEPITEPTYLGWSARGDRLLLVDTRSRMLLYDTSRTSDPRVLSAELGIDRVQIGFGYNFRSTYAFRPPLGEEILFVDPARQALMAVRTDGTGLRTLIDASTSTVGYTSIGGADWSPDGSQLLLLMVLPDFADHPELFVVNADGSGLRRLRGDNPLDEYNSPKWSPDGTRIGFQFWTRHPERNDGLNEDFHGIGVYDLATGVVTDLGPIQNNGFTTWEFSPDGASILEMPGDGSNDMNIVDIETGEWTTTPWRVADPITWQRTAD